MRILVTGGEGFIGSNLCKVLVSNHNVFSIDNHFTGSENNRIPGVSYIYDNTKHISRYDYIKPNVIFHLGEYSRVEQSFEDKNLVFDYNIIGTREVFDYALRYNARIIYAGSSTKFGDIGPNSSPYAWSKANNTQLVKNYHDWFGLNYSIVYFYNVYGAGEISEGKYATLIAKFIKKYKNNEVLTVTAPGTQKRNFTHIDDTVDALKFVLDKGTIEEYSIGSTEAYSVLDIAKLFNTEIKMTDSVPGNRNTAAVNISSTLDLGWKPKHSVKTYIESIL